jgi:hypothetical protein
MTLTSTVMGRMSVRGFSLGFVGGMVGPSVVRAILCCKRNSRSASYCRRRDRRASDALIDEARQAPAEVLRAEGKTGANRCSCRPTRIVRMERILGGLIYEGDAARCVILLHVAAEITKDTPRGSPSAQTPAGARKAHDEVGVFDIELWAL